MARDDSKRSLPRLVRRTLSSLNCDGIYGLLLLAFMTAIVLVEAGGDAVRYALRYDRAALADGEGWRFLTAHVVHLDLEHAILNALGLALMWALFARDFTPDRWASILGLSTLTIGAGLWFLSPQVGWYVGASGVLHGAMAAGTVAHLRRRDLDGFVLLAFLVAKIGYEQWADALPFADGSAAPVVVDAHLYGALGGLAAALVLRSRAEPL
jgi:rhomboid family GlyGly-CTERM serine protease